MGVAGRRRARHRRHVRHHHHRNVHRHNRRRRHHRSNLTSRGTSVILSSNQTVGTVAPAPYKGLGKFGTLMSLPGTILTCLSAVISSATFIIPGCIHLGVGSLLIIISTILAFRCDRKRHFTGHDRLNICIDNWNERVRNDAKYLFVWLLVGSALACTGFVQYSRYPLAIAGCSMISLAFVVLLVGLILGHCLDFEEMTDGTSQPQITTAGETNRPSSTTADIESNPDPIPTISANTSNPTSDTASSVSSEGSHISNKQLLSDLQVLGTFLFIPGVCFCCICWIKYYHDYDRIVVGTLGAILLCIGGLMILISTLVVFCKASEVSEKRSEITKIGIMFFVSGVPLTAVGFTHLQPEPGLALGVAGACLTGLSLISYLIMKSRYKKEQSELTSSVNVVPIFQNVNVQFRNESGYPPGSSNDPAYPGPDLGYPTYARSEMPNPAYPGTYHPYPPGSSPEYQVFPSAAGADPAYPPAMYGPAQRAPPTAQSADNDLPSYMESKNMPTPSFQASDIPSTPLVPPVESSSNRNQAYIPPFQHVYEEDLPPPPSYDDVVK